MSDPGPGFSDVFADLFTDAGVELDTPVDLDPDEVFTASVPVGTWVDTGTVAAKFDGDTSQLPAEVCWALQELVAAPHVSEKSRRHWAAVLQHEQVLRSRLSELGLVLELSHEHRYAFTRQAEDPSPHSRVILRTKTLSLAASALALFSKSDEEYAAQALAVFDEFGFQLVMAAPIRMSGIVEPFIGQAVLVEKRVTADGARSNAASATFGELAARRASDHDEGASANT